MKFSRRFAAAMPSLTVAAALVTGSIMMVSRSWSEKHDVEVIEGAGEEDSLARRPTLMLFGRETRFGPQWSPAMQGLVKAFRMVRFNPPTNVDASVIAAIAAERLQVTTLPQVVLLDGKGRGVARLALETEADVTPAAVGELMRVLKQRDERLETSRIAGGKSRAEALDRALEVVGEFRGDYVPEMQEIIALDAGNALGLRGKYVPVVASLQLDVAIQQQIYPLIDQHNFDDAVARLDDLIEQWGPDSRRLDMLYAFKGQILYSMGEQKLAVASLDDALRYATAGSEKAGRIQLARSQMLTATP